MTKIIWLESDNSIDFAFDCESLLWAKKTGENSYLLHFSTGVNLEINNLKPDLVRKLVSLWGEPKPKRRWFW